MIVIAGTATAQPAPRWDGTWRNEANSVRIRARKCGPAMCGTVIWASEKAKADAARGGTDRLVGTTLLRDFEADADGLWYGEVYVPDIGQTFSGTVELTDRDTLVGTGCLFATIGCRSQTWKRVR